jgi:hypothetical protein
MAEIVRHLALRTETAPSMMLIVKPRRVTILAFPGIQPLDVVGPAEVFSAAALLAPTAYTVEVVASKRPPAGAQRPTLAKAGTRSAVVLLGSLGPDGEAWICSFECTCAP